MKREVLKVLTRESVLPLFRRFQAGVVTIFMLHRFADVEYRNDGHSSDALRVNLSFLRRHRYRLIGLPDLLNQFDDDQLWTEPGVIFTVDDGYGDFARVAAPIFAEFDCPVTVFVTTAFVDGGFWMWWDKISWAFTETTQRSVELEVCGALCRYVLDGDGARVRAATDLSERLKRVSEPVMQRVVDELLRITEVHLPRDIPDMFLPMTWDDVSRCARQGVTFGPHTVTHPILSQVDDHRAQAEIEGSWQRLSASTSAAIPVFCFPNGDYASFTDRDRKTVRSVGMRACVLAEQHFTTLRQGAFGDSGVSVELPRFGYPDDPAEFRQIVGGLERLKRRFGTLAGRSLSSSSASTLVDVSTTPRFVLR